MISTYDVVILGKIVDLANRFGVALSDTHAVLITRDGKKVIEFSGSPTEAEALGRFDRMLTSLGSHGDNCEVVGSDIDDLNSKLDHALCKAPRSRTL